MKWTVELQRKALIQLNPEKVQKALTAIARAAERNQRLGFSATALDVPDPEQVAEDDGPKVYYRARIRLTEHKARTPAKAQARFDYVLKILTRRAERLGWRVVAQEAHAQPPESDNVTAEPSTRPPFRLPVLTAEAFQGIYERDAHVRIIHAAMETYVSTQGKKASHILLYGEPAAAKSSLLQRFKTFYEKGDAVERVLFIDAQSMTRAGLEDWLLDRAEPNDLPEVLVFEELEKQPPAILLPLISVLGSGYVMKVNARVGRKVQQTKVVAWGTCNDAARLREFHDGALWSRFTHKLHCPRPSRELMHQILLQEVADRPDGNPAWADRALTFGWDVLQTNDPREIIGLLDGRDRLLTGEYQKDYLAVRRPTARSAA